MSIVVPFAKPQPSALGSASADATTAPGDPFALMAAAQMHSEGRLVQNDDQDKTPADEVEGKEFYDTIRNKGSISVDPRQLSVQPYLKNLPNDIEQYGPKTDKKIFLRTKEVPTS